MLGRLRGFLGGGLWRVDVDDLESWRALPLKFLRLLVVSFRDLSSGDLTLRAMGLVYTTLLSLVPLLAVSFSVLKAFGVHNQAEPVLLRVLAPLGPRAEEIVTTVIGFVENMRVGVLGSLGLAMLVYTVISLAEKVEEALNHIWRVRRSRSFARRFSDYMSVILVGPVLLFSGLSLGASLAGSAIARRLLAGGTLGVLAVVASKAFPMLLLGGAFTFLYVFIPGEKVRWRSAAVGGACAMLLWQLVGSAFTAFIVTSGHYSAVYSGFALLVLLLIWVYVSWLVLLVGAKIAYYHQYPHFLLVPRESLTGHRMREKLAFMVMAKVARSFYADGPRWTLESLVHELRLPVEPVEWVLHTLVRRGMLVESGDPPAYLPARSLLSISLREVLDSVREADADTAAAEERHVTDPTVDALFRNLEAAQGAALGGLTLADLAVSGVAGAAEAGAAPAAAARPPGGPAPPAGS